MSRLEQLPVQPDEKHFEIPHKGLKLLADMLDGNGVRAGQVRLIRHDTQVHVVHAFMHIDIKPDLATSQISGNQPSGTVVTDKEAVLHEAAAKAAALAADTQVQAEILEFIGKLPGQGFGDSPFKMKSAAAPETYSVIDKCARCNGMAKCQCTSCNGNGQTACTGCVGQGYTQCPVCYGTGQQQRADGARTPCSKCSGSGRSLCMTCQGAKTLRCAVCSGNGNTPCTTCGRTGYSTQIFTAHWQVEGTFGLDRKDTSPEVIEVVELIGVQKTATDGHAEILLLMPEMMEGKLVFPYAALLPVAQVEFNVAGKTHPAVVAGLHGRLIEIEPLLDNLIKPGVGALVKLSKGPLAAAALIANACRFRVIRQVLAGLSHHGKSNVYHGLMRQYPLLISEKFGKATVRYADTALLSLSEGPRWKGLLAGTACAAGLFALYFLTPLRESGRGMLVTQNLEKHALALDVAIWSVGCILTFFIIKFFAASALKKMLPQSAQVKEAGLPAAGRQGWFSMLSTFIVWACCALAASPQPEWLMSILKKLGL